MNMNLQFFGGRGSGGGKGGSSGGGKKIFSVEGSKPNITEDMVVDGAVINYSGNNLGTAVSEVADRLNVGDEFVISNEQLGFIAPNPTAADIKGQRRETRFVVTDSYRYGNGFAPVYGNNKPSLNQDKSRSWRNITDGAAYLVSGTNYSIKIKRK